MQDRFKFRAWCKRHREMVYNDDYGCHYITNEGILNYFQRLDNYYTTYILYKYDENNIILMQCTGLKDRNDKPIYEGDIVYLGDKKHDDKYEVVWNRTCYVIVNNKKTLNIIFESELEIIGNIYENPDLLEQK